MKELFDFSYPRLKYLPDRRSSKQRIASPLRKQGDEREEMTVLPITNGNSGGGKVVYKEKPHFLAIVVYNQPPNPPWPMPPMPDAICKTIRSGVGLVLVCLQLHNTIPKHYQSSTKGKQIGNAPKG